MKHVQLPPLAENTGDVLPEMQFEEYKISCARMAQEQDISVSTEQLWVRTSIQQNPLSQPGELLVLPPNSTEARVGRSRSGSRINALGLMALTRKWHQNIAEYQNGLLEIDRGWDTGEVGIVLPATVSHVIELPRHFGVKALVAATYAVNDHLSR